MLRGIHHAGFAVVGTAAVAVCLAFLLATSGQAIAASDPAPAASAYLEALAQAPLSGAAASGLTADLAPASTAAATETLLAKGTALDWASHGDYPDHATCSVTVENVSLTSPTSATVTARAVTDTYMTASSHMTAVSDPGENYEGDALTHTLYLSLVNGSWLVTKDVNTSDVAPAYLTAAGAPASTVQAAEARVVAALDSTDGATSTATVPIALGVTPLYHGVETYSGSAAATYADKYWTNYNPNYENFASEGGDCTNFTSQCGYAGGLWEYDGGTSSTNWYPYCKSWIAVPYQMTAWHTAYYSPPYIPAWVSSASALGKGDFIYYDWTGDGVWDHATVVVTSDGEYVDAHTTDHHHVYWKDLYESGTKCKYGETCSSFAY